MPAKSQLDKDLGRKVRKLLKLQAEVKERYKLMDGITADLSKELVPGQPKLISRREKALLEDNFGDSWKAFKTVSFTRYEVKIIPA